jgi:uncharacterized RDD family membrane protein YckC
MSEYGSGSPPPSGGNPSGGQYGQQPYGTPPPGYGAPPPQPEYNAPPPGYGGATPPPYGATPPPFGAPAPGPTGYGNPYGAPMGLGTPASMGKRLAARLLDGILVGVVLTVLGLVLVGGSGSQLQVDPVTGEVTAGGATFMAGFMSYMLILLVVTLCYEVVLIALKGATLGKQLMHIKVVQQDTGQLPGWGPSILRWLIPQAAGAICGLITPIVYLSPLFDSTGRYQGWHDKVAKTLVVEG